MILGFDVETTGLTQQDRIIEIGAVLFNDSWVPVAQESVLVWDDTVPPITKEIEELTGIDPRLLVQTGVAFPQALAKIGQLIGGRTIKCFCAHNAEFDRMMLMTEISRWKIPPIKELDLPWVCTQRDIKHGKRMKSLRLSHLALDYGVPVDPRTLHRAAADVLLMGEMVKASGASIDEMIKRATADKLMIRAIIPKPWDDGGRGKDAAKAAGFRWDDNSKSWLYECVEFELEDLQKTWAFKVEVLK